MKIKLLFLVTLLAISGSLLTQSASAQNPTNVSGTITDPNGVAYFPATVTACLTPVTTSPIVNGQHVNPNEGTNYCAPLVNTTSTGFFSLSLFPNSAITPGGTQWRFTVTAAGASPPSGKGSQTFQSSITISGTSQDVSATLTAASLALLNSGGGGISPVSSLPATCTPGVTAPVNLTINGIGYGVFYCSATNTWTPDNPQVTISPIAYGAKWDAKFTYSAVTTAASSTITCPANDCNFTSADIGKIIFAYESPFSANNGVGSYQVLLTQTTISAVNSATSISVSPTTATNSCNTPVSAVCILVWATQDDAPAINLAATAAWSAGGLCRAVQFPTGFALIGGPVLNVTSALLSSACGGTSAGTSGIDLTQTGPEVYGQGPGNTLLIPTPNYNYVGCTFGQSSHGCIATTPNLEAHDFGVFGAGQSAISGSPTITLFELNGSPSGGICTGSTGFNLSITNWGVQDANSTGLDIGREACGDPTYTNIVAELVGGTATCNITTGNNGIATVLITNGLACFGNYTAGGSVASINLSGGSAQAPGVISTNGSYFGNAGAGTGNVVAVNGSAGTWNSFGDFIACINATGCTAVRLMNTSTTVTANLNGDSIAVGTGATGGQTLWLNGAGGAMHVKNTIAIGTGANTSLLQITAGNRFYDDGGNQFSNGTQANGIPIGTFFGSLSSNNALVTAAKTVLSAGWGNGPATSTALSGGDAPIQFTITNTGAGQGASPTITYTFPTPYFVTPFSCTALQTGGTNATGTFATSSLTTTGVVFTFSLTPTAAATEIVQVTCVLP